LLKISSNKAAFCITLFYTRILPPVIQQSYSDLGHLISAVSRSHADTRHSVRILWTRLCPAARDLYLTTEHTQERDIHALAEFEHTSPAGESPQTYGLDRAASGTGKQELYQTKLM